jgi:hypothetical protein
MKRRTLRRVRIKSLREKVVLTIAGGIFSGAARAIITWLLNHHAN